MKQILHSFVYLLLFIPVMNGCGLYEKYQRPEISLIDSLYNNLPPIGTIEKDTTSIAKMSWTEFFSDTCLQQLINVGLNNNTNLAIARLKVQEAEAVLQTSRLAFLPSLSFSAQGNVSSFDGTPAKKTYSIGPSSDWELEAFGSLTQVKRGKQAALETQLAYMQAVKTELIATIANSYYTLLMLDEQINISRSTLKNWEENVRTLSALKRAGKTNETAVLQAKANKLNVEGSVLSLEKQIVEQETAITTLLGIAPQKIVRGTLANQTFPQELSVGLPLSLLDSRPDIRRAEAALAQAFYVTQEARANFYPRVKLSGSAGWTNNGVGAITNPGDWLLSALGSITAPLFDRGVNKANYNIAKARQEEALLLLRQALLDAGEEVNNALVQWQTAKERQAIDHKQILHLRAAVWNTRLLMKHGLSNYLEILTAQQHLLQAELSVCSDKYDEIQGVITLYRALGEERILPTELSSSNSGYFFKSA